MRILNKNVVLIILALMKVTIFATTPLPQPAMSLSLNEFRSQANEESTYHLGFMGTDQNNKADKIPFIVSLRSNNPNSSFIRDFDHYYIFQDLRKEQFLEKLASEPNPDLQYYIYGDGQRDWKFSRASNQEMFIQNNGAKLSFTFRTRKPFRGFIPFTFMEQLKFDATPERISPNEWVIKANVNPPEDSIDFWIVDQKNKRPIQWIEIEFKKPIKNNIPNKGSEEK